MAPIPMLLAMCLALGLPGCVRGGFQTAANGAADGAGGADGRVADGAPTVDARAPVDPLAPFGSFTSLPSINTAAEDDDPSLPADGLEIYFERGGNLWRALRPTTSAPFGPPERAVELEGSTGGEESAALSDDGLTIYFASTRDHPQALGARDIFVATRPTRAARWSTPQPVAELNSPGDDEPGSLSPDQLTMYLTVDLDGAGGNLCRATRPSRSAPWTAPALIPGLSSGQTDRRPWIDPSGTVLYFGSNRGGGPGHSDIWVSRRADTGQPFGAPELLVGINTADHEEEVWLSPDQRTIYLVSDRTGTAGSDDIFVAHR